MITIAVIVAVLFAASLLPLFGAAAPAGQVAQELGALTGPRDPTAAQSGAMGASSAMDSGAPGAAQPAGSPLAGGGSLGAANGGNGASVPAEGRLILGGIYYALSQTGVLAGGGGSGQAAPTGGDQSAGQGAGSDDAAGENGGGSGATGGGSPTGQAGSAGGSAGFGGASAGSGGSGGGFGGLFGGGSAGSGMAGRGASGTGGGFPGFAGLGSLFDGSGDGDGSTIPGQQGGTGQSPSMSGGSAGGVDTADGGQSTASSGDRVQQDGAAAAALGGENLACGQTAPFTICYEQPLAPGTDTTVYVIRDGRPVAGVTVMFNGDVVGVTDSEGRLTTEVPYLVRIRIGVRAPARAIGIDRSQQLKIQQPANGSVDAAVTSEFALALLDTPEPGATGGVEVTIDDRPVPAAQISIDGEPVTKTNDGGQALVQYPRRASVTVTARRGEFEASQTVALVSRTVTVYGPGPFGSVIPGKPATIVVADGERPIDGATVSIAGTPVGTTDANGYLTTELPLRPRVTITVTAAGVDTTHRKPVYLLQGVTLTLGLLGFGLVAVVWYRSGFSTSGTSRSIREFLRSIGHRVLQTFVRVATWLQSTGARLRASLLALHDQLRAAIAAPAVWLRSRPAALRGWLAAILARVRGWLMGQLQVDLGLPRSSDASDDDTDTAANGVDSTDRSLSARERIEQLWAAFVARVGVASRRSTTPGQVAREARATGLPAHPVRALTDAYRAVEYSSTEPGSVLEMAETAAADLESSDSESQTRSMPSDETAEAETGAESDTDGSEGSP